MSSSHGRQTSPRGRRIVSAGRTSTGSFANPSAYYNYAAPPRTSTDYVPGPRTSADRVDGAKLVTLRPRSPPRRARDDDYGVQRRPRTLSLDPGDSQYQKPLNLMAPKSSNKPTRPIITREVESPSSTISSTGGAQLEASYIMPASSSSGRQRHRRSSLTTGDRLTEKDWNRGERVYPGGSSSLRLPPQKPAARDERGHAYEYTAPRDEVLRDLAPRQRPREENYTSTRPASMINLDRSDNPYARMDRDAPPLASNKGFENVGRSNSVRHGTRARDDDLGRRDLAARRYPRDDHDHGRYREPPRSHIAPREDYVPHPEEDSRHQRPRRPPLEGERPPQKLRDPLDERYDRGEERHRRVHHHREHDHRKDYDEREERERRREHDDRDRRVRDEPPRHLRDNREEAGLNSGLVAGGGAVAAAGLAAEGARKHRHRDEDFRSLKDSLGYLRQPDQASESTSISGDAKGGGDRDEEDDREKRRRRRRREREREDRENRGAREEAQHRAQDPSLAQAEGGQQQVALVPPKEQSLREQGSYERPPETSGEEPRRHRKRHHHHRRHHAHTHTSDSYSDPSSSSCSPSSDSDLSTNRLPRQPPRVVSPPTDATETAPKPPPKGILKPPREKFPEEPSTIREGVAPLEAAKKGIPPEARWTRINRRLVNPEALEMENVRFEEFPDHVIVLKVLNQEEIAKFTKLTHEVRERRRLEHGDAGSG
ncbi:MAG: hypothetical protein Q9217_006606, partial [Psora testacea]